MAAAAMSTEVSSRSQSVKSSEIGRPVSITSDSADGSYYSAGSTQSIGKESVRSNKSTHSTKSLSVFLNPNASLTMPRFEEMTYNIYDQVNYDPNPASNTTTGKKSKSKSKGSSKKHSKSETSTENKKSKSTTTIKQGTFQITGIAASAAAKSDSNQSEISTGKVSNTQIAIEKTVNAETASSSSTRSFGNFSTAAGNGNAAASKRVTENIIEETTVPRSAIVEDTIQTDRGLIAAAPENPTRLQRVSYVSAVSVNNPKVSELLAGEAEAQGTSSAPATLARGASRSDNGQSSKSDIGFQEITVVKQRIDDEPVSSGVEVIPGGTVSRITRELSKDPSLDGDEPASSGVEVIPGGTVSRITREMSKDPSLDGVLVSSPSTSSLGSMERKNKQYLTQSSVDDTTEDRAAKIKSRRDEVTVPAAVKGNIRSTAAVQLSQSEKLAREISNVSATRDDTDKAIPIQDIKFTSKTQVASDADKTPTPSRRASDVVQEIAVSSNSVPKLSIPKPDLPLLTEDKSSAVDQTSHMPEEPQLNSLISTASTSVNSGGYARDVSDDHDDSIRSSKVPEGEVNKTKQPLTVEVLGPFTTSSSDNTPQDRQAYQGMPWARRTPAPEDSDSTLTGDSDQYEGRQVKVTPRERMRRGRSLDDDEVRGEPVKVSRGIMYEPKKRSESSSNVEYDRSPSYQGRGQRGTPRQKLSRDEKDLDDEGVPHEPVHVSRGIVYEPKKRSESSSHAEFDQSPPYQRRDQRATPREKLHRDEKDLDDEEVPHDPVHVSRGIVYEPKKRSQSSSNVEYDRSPSYQGRGQRGTPRQKLPRDEKDLDDEEVPHEPVHVSRGIVYEPKKRSESSSHAEFDQSPPYQGRGQRGTPRQKLPRDEKDLDDEEVPHEPVHVSRGIVYEPKKRSESSSYAEFDQSPPYQGRGQRGTPREKLRRDEKDLDDGEEFCVSTTRVNPMRSTVEGYKSPGLARTEYSRSPLYQGRDQRVVSREVIHREDYRGTDSEEEEESPRVIATRVFPTSVDDSHRSPAQNVFSFDESSSYPEPLAMPRKKAEQDDSGAESGDRIMETSTRVVTSRKKVIDSYESPEDDFDEDSRHRSLDVRPRASSWEYLSAGDRQPENARISETKVPEEHPPISIQIYSDNQEPLTSTRYVKEEQPRRSRVVKEKKVTQRRYVSEKDTQSREKTSEKKRTSDAEPISIRIVPYNAQEPPPSHVIRAEESRHDESTSKRERKRVGGQLTTRIYERSSPSPDNFKRTEDRQRSGLENVRIYTNNPVSARIYPSNRDDGESPLASPRRSLTKPRNEGFMTSDSDLPDRTTTRVSTSQLRRVSRGYPDAESDDASIYSEPAYPPSRRSRSVNAPIPSLRPISVNISHSVRDSPAAVAGVIRVKSRSQNVSEYADYQDDRTTPVAGIISVHSSRSTPMAYPMSPQSQIEQSPMVGIISITEPQPLSPRSYYTTPSTVPSGFIDATSRNRSPYPTSAYRNGGFDAVSPYPQNGLGYDYDGNMTDVHNLTQRMMTPEPEVAGIDPELKDAQKAGNTYHIAMNVRPALFTRPEQPQLSPPEMQFSRPERRLSRPEMQFNRPEMQFSRPESQFSRPESRGLNASRTPPPQFLTSTMRPYGAASPYPDNSIFMEYPGEFVRSVSVVNTPAEMDYGSMYLTSLPNVLSRPSSSRSRRTETDVEFDLKLLNLPPAPPEYDDADPIETTYNDRYVIAHIDQTVEEDRPPAESRYILGRVTETPTPRKEKKLPNVIQNNSQNLNAGDRNGRRQASEVYEFVEEVVESRVEREGNGYEERSLPKERPLYIQDREHKKIDEMEPERDRSETKVSRERDNSSKGSRGSSRKKYADETAGITKPIVLLPPSAAPRSRSSKTSSVAKPDHNEVGEYSKTTHITVSETSRPTKSRSGNARAPSDKPAYTDDRKSHRDVKTCELVCEPKIPERAERYYEDSLPRELPRLRNETASKSTASSRPRSPLSVDQNNNYDEKAIVRSDTAREPSIISDSTIQSESVNSIIRVHRGDDGYEARPVSDDVSRESVNLGYRDAFRDPGIDRTDLNVSDVMLKSPLTGGFSDNAGDYGDSLDRKMDQRGRSVAEYMRKTTGGGQSGGGGGVRGGASGRPSVTAPFEDDDFDREIRVNRDFSMYDRKRDDSDDERPKSRSTTSSRRQTDQSQNVTSLTKLDVRSLYVGAPAHSVKQTIKVDRLEDEILSSLPRGSHPGFVSARYASPPPGDGTTSPLDGYDSVDEQVEMDVARGKAFLTARVLSEKIVPILGTEEMFKKSSVIVTRRIEVDLTVTPQRKSLYEVIARRQRAGGSSGDFSPTGMRGRYNSDSTQGLTQEEKAELYRVFMALAELDKAQF